MALNGWTALALVVVVAASGSGRAGGKTSRGRESSGSLSRSDVSPTDWLSLLASYVNTRPKPKGSGRWLRGKGPRTARLRSRPRPPSPPRPNVVLIMTDDQDAELGSLEFMPKLNRYLREEGVRMENGFVTTPMCCPSRSSMLTGLYAHNHNVLTNNDNCSSTDWVERHEPRTFAPYMRDAGYRTGYFGKYLNKYMGNHIPEGWDEWSALVRNSRFYNYTVNINGEKVRHGWDYEKDYFPDIITNSSLAFIRRSKLRRPDQPVLMVMSYPGPHGPEDSAPQYQDLFLNVTTHHTPAYDYAPNPDKQWILQVTDRMEPIEKRFTDLLMTKRLQTLQSIDDAIERLHAELKAIGELENTYIFYTSDHGYHLGQFGLVKGKAFPFDVDVKVPFFVRGPKLDPGAVKKEPVLNIDLAPTFLDIAGVPVPRHMDGQSILPALLQDDVMSDTEKAKRNVWRDSFLVERGKMTVERYEKVKGDFPFAGTSNRKRWPDEDGVDMPFSGPESHLLEKPRFTKQERLAVECLKPRFRAPCQKYQRRKCIRKKNGDWKMVSCRSDDHDDFYAAGACVCDGAGEVKKEKRLQKQFLKKHLTPSGKRQQRKLRHKFLQFDSDAARVRRSEGEQEPPVAAVLEAIAEEEIDQVDIIMEDISDEIQDLQQSIVNSTIARKPNAALNVSSSRGARRKLGCKTTKDCFDDGNDIFNVPLSWKASRAYINEQIRRLRAQLQELKEIRKHLKKKQLLASPGVALQSKCQCSSKKSKSQLKRHQSRRRARREWMMMDRLRKRLLREERRQLKKAKKLRREKRKKKRQESCSAKEDDKLLNCFSHNNDHWRTEPKWKGGSFCACTNSNTNTYWCVRTINATHNYLYCEFVSGIITYFNLNVDPYQLRNIYQTLSDAELNYMHLQLLGLKDYSGFDGRWRPARPTSGDGNGLPGVDYSSPMQKSIGKWRSKKKASRQMQFIKRYGQRLPPPEAYNRKQRGHYRSYSYDRKRRILDRNQHR